METPPLAQIAVDSAGTLLTDITCRQCGYNLRGLSGEGKCSECGTPVAMSIRADYLRFANPAWIEKVSLGVRILVWMILINIVVSIAAALLMPVWGPLVLMVVGFLVSVVSYYGSWLLAEPEVSKGGEAGLTRARRMVRLMLGIGLCGPVLNIIAELMGSTQLLGTLVQVAVVVIGIAGIVGEYFKFVIYADLARRIPDRAMAERANFLRKAYIATMTLSFVIGSVVVMIGTGGGVSASFAAIGCTAAVVGVVFIVFAIMTIILLIRLNKALQAQAQLARQSWTGAGGPSLPVSPYA